MKMAYFYLMIIEITAEETVCLYFKYIFKYYNILNSIVINYSTQFILKFTISLLNLYEIHSNKYIIFYL